MRETAKPRNDVAVTLCPAQKVGIVEGPDQRHRPLLVGKVLAVLEGEVQEQPLQIAKLSIKSAADCRVGDGTGPQIAAGACGRPR